MYAYCNNNAVNLVDATGTLPFGIGPMTVAINDGGGRTPTQRYYVSADKAAIDFARRNYRYSRYEGIEYGAIIYSRTSANMTKYTYGRIIIGTEDYIEYSFNIDNSLLASGWNIAGFVHTHPNYSSFSSYDSNSHGLNVTINPYFSSYVVFGPTPDSFIIRKLYGVFNILVYPNKGGGIPGVRNAIVNAIF